ncbi:MAG: hypothetical protein A2Y03_07955 [Omnitrophica WOR_2 bacterium GWF2_38_59]|nr:MAG: hypothetical protein A2Y06_07420 [Omnitrophica WOR_2 bacterium GWA2_37_7]OGX24468.1 MAG: hypothetical protein A2Y03_07955 [Omnitrophica WOR_2 bacterium GWF2_38_59]OGX50390.1 MAG: hypothetical protein A2243_02265 [Omnitrophica WOR_2 bacterium RIFOXYA2_FULL_38_17]OGX50749.1 MAG: hypothetical protein A2267_11035 [Omnitrophica WOR_2 bacterium RIFOXYA12_FULL_38_10]OGX58605.1 MAG: hypothetical protein A2447_00325 [Omnitrophica WOR_2 bacterium RIFOXYC2_FULL_38_12]OGX59233.1 MAG: hypothetical 
MEINFIVATGMNLLINLLYTILALFIGVCGMKFVDNKLLKQIDLEKEIKEGNIAAAIFASTLVIFVAIIVAAGFKG